MSRGRFHEGCEDVIHITAVGCGSPITSEFLNQCVGGVLTSHFLAISPSLASKRTFLTHLIQHAPEVAPHLPKECVIFAAPEMTA